MRLEIARLHRRMKATTLYVTHDQVEAMTLADRIVVMNKGNMEQVGAPLDLYRRPQTLFVARFIGSPTMNTLPAHIVAQDERSATLSLPDGTIPLPKPAAANYPDEIVLGLRAEDMGPVADGEPAWLSGTVSIVERLGSQTFAYVETDGGATLSVQFPRTSAVAVGERLRLSGAPDHVHLFDPGTGQRLN
ncbi:ABC transporter ATP-binding protein [Aureimonas frigidaquae]|nr:TOBE domain-containing protein [Aureimonas frigidaquae]